MSFFCRNPPEAPHHTQNKSQSPYKGLRALWKPCVTWSCLPLQPHHLSLEFTPCTGFSLLLSHTIQCAASNVGTCCSLSLECCSLSLCSNVTTPDHPISPSSHSATSFPFHFLQGTWHHLMCFLYICLLPLECKLLKGRDLLCSSMYSHYLGAHQSFLSPWDLTLSTLLPEVSSSFSVG